MKNERGNGGIFLIEFLIMLLIFTVCSLVALQLFAKSRLFDEQALHNDRAAVIATSASGEVKQYFLTRTGDSNADLTAMYNDDCEMDPDGAYTASFTGKIEDGLLSGELTVFYDGEALITIPVAQFYGGAK